MKAKTKKILAGTAALSLVAAVAIGGTYAYLTRETEQRANNFTFASDAVDAMLTEPDWDGVVDYEYDDDCNITPIYNWLDDDADPDTPPVPVYGFENGDIQKPVTDKTKADDPTTDRPRKDSNDDTFNPTYGDEQAQNMIPGQTAAKNPKITNTGITDEWVAAKITFVYGEGAGADKAGKPLNKNDMKAVTDAVDIDYKTNTADNWDRVSGLSTDVSQVFYYKNIVAVDGETDPIFTTVTVKTTADSDEIKALEDMGGFAIWIEGFAVQSDIAEEYSSTDATVVTFKSWGNDGGVTFNNTPTDDAPATVAKPGILPKK